MKLQWGICDYNEKNVRYAQKYHLLFLFLPSSDARFPSEREDRRFGTKSAPRKKLVVDSELLSNKPFRRRNAVMMMQSAPLRSPEIPSERPR